jgi:hypothetical protein
MKETRWYQEDLCAAAPRTGPTRFARRRLGAPPPPRPRPTHPLPPRPHSFGLKTVDEAGKLHFNTTEGNHLQFSKEQLAWWVKHQFV